MEQEVENLKVDKENVRIDSYLASKQNISRVTIQRLLENGKIKVNGKNVKASYKVQLNDFIEIEKANRNKYKASGYTS